MIEENTFRQEEEPIENALRKLQRICEILKEMGYSLYEENIKAEFLDPRSNMAWIGFPIASEGLDGIRCSNDKYRGLIIWFTNGFEKRDDPRRQEIVKRIQAENLAYTF